MNSHWIERAKTVLPAGSLGNFDPGIFIKEGRGSRVWDEDGKEYVDYLIGSGPMLLGHGNPEVLDAVNSQLGKGMTFFTNNSACVELAEVICRTVPCAEQIRYVASGGEADMYAIRLARAYTGRTKLLKFEGGYHGMSAEAQMSLAPTQRANFPQAVPDSAGIPNSVKDDVLVAPFNDIESVRAILDDNENKVAAIIVEPLQRIVPPKANFLAELKTECEKRSILLIFDEIVTGYRLDLGGAQTYYGVTPDICTLGKVIGGGFPLAAIAASADIMKHFDKSNCNDRFLMQLGTLSGNPVASVAGLKTIEILERDNSYERLHATGKKLMALYNDALSKSGKAFQLVGEPTLFDVLFIDSTVNDYRDSQKADSEINQAFNRVLREQGLLKAPGKLYPSTVIGEEELQITEAAFAAAVETISAL